MLTLASPIVYSLPHVAEDMRRYLIFQHLCDSFRGAFWVALVGPILLAGDKGYLTALDMKELTPEHASRAASPWAGNREAIILN